MGEPVDGAMVDCEVCETRLPRHEARWFKWHSWEVPVCDDPECWKMMWESWDEHRAEQAERQQLP